MPDVAPADGVQPEPQFAKGTWCAHVRFASILLALNLPASQLLHEAELVCAVEAENLPAAQLLQAAEPAIGLYVPAAQASHVEVPV